MIREARCLGMRVELSFALHSRTFTEPIAAVNRISLIRPRFRKLLFPMKNLASVAEGVHHLFRKRGNNGATMWLKALDMKTHLNEIRVPPALFRGLTAIGFAVLLVGLMFASKGGGV